MRLTITAVADCEGARSDAFDRGELSELEEELESAIASYLIGRVDSFGLDLTSRVEIT